MKLLHIISENDGCIEQALVPVPDDYDERHVLREVGFVVINPTVEAVYEIDIEKGDETALKPYRPFYG